MSSKKALSEGLRRIDPVGEKRLDHLEQSAPPQLLLEKLLEADDQAPSTATDGRLSSPPWRRRGPRLAFAGVIVLAGVTAALIIGAGSGNTPKAFAVEPQKSGGVKIQIYSLSEPSELEAALEDAGIRAQVNWLPAGKVCREPHYTPSVVHLPGGGRTGGMTMGGGPNAHGVTIRIGSTKSWRETFAKYRRGEISRGDWESSLANFNLDPATFRPDQSVVLSGTPVPWGGDPEGGSITSFAVAEGPVKPCRSVPALPTGEGSPFPLSPGGGPGYRPIGDKALSRAAIAGELRQAATAAKTSAAGVKAPPGPDQFLYVKTRVTHLEAWNPDDPSGSKAKPRYFTDRQLSAASAMPAIVPTIKEVWTAPDGTTRQRETLAPVKFLSGEDQHRWQAAGSPPPFEYDPAEHAVGRDSSGELVKDFRRKAFRGRREFAYMSRLARLPTEPEALRLEIENRQPGSSPLAPSPADSPRGGGTVERLLGILSEPLAPPSLRAAGFEALAEIPGIGFERGVSDAVGRRGDAISWVGDMGSGRRYIFDPQSSRILSDAEVIFDAKAAHHPGLPDWTVSQETAFLRSAIVDSDQEGASR